MLSTFELGVDRISEIVHAAFHIRTWAGSALVEHAMVGKIAGRIARKVAMVPRSLLTVSSFTMNPLAFELMG